MADSPSDNQKLWSTIYKLYDRDNSGFADEGDTIAAMVTMGRKPEEARRMVVRRCDDGRANLQLFQSLFQECISLNLAGVDLSASGWQKELVKHLLGVLREFERRALARGEFMIAAESRHRVKQLKETEELRQKDEMVVRQGTEKSGVAEAHVREAVEFNQAWTTNMSEFELRATQIVQELRPLLPLPLPYPYPYPYPFPTPTPTLNPAPTPNLVQDLRDRQEAALVAMVETTREEAKARVKPSKVCTRLRPCRLRTPLCYAHARRCFPITYTYASAYNICIWLQPLSYTAAASITYGCRRCST